MTSDLSSCVLEVREVASARLPGIETVRVAGHAAALPVALPASYARRRRQRYPLIVVLEAQPCFGSAVEMSRLMAETREVRETVIVRIALDTAALAAPDAVVQGLRDVWLPACFAQLRCDEAQTTVFGSGETAALAVRALTACESLCNAIIGEPSADAAMQATPLGTRRILIGCGPDTAAAAELQRRLCDGGASVALRRFDGAACGELLVPSFVAGLRELFATGEAYGDKVVPLRKPAVVRTLETLRPLFARLRRPPAPAHGGAYRVTAPGLARDFEVFATLPASAAQARTRRYPALVVLDANIEFATVAETAARMARAGAIEELVVIGVGVPRDEGPKEFAYRRFEEFSPPVEGDAADDELGRIFRSLFALRGQRAMQRLGRAPWFLAFLVDELLPRLAATLPIDVARLGLLGHSAGGTFVGYALAERPAAFRHYAAVSPGIGISDGWLMKQPHAALGDAAASVFLCVGSEEMENAFNRIAGIPDTKLYARHLRARGVPELIYRQYEHETHSSVFPRAASEVLAAFFARARASEAAAPRTSAA